MQDAADPRAAALARIRRAIRALGTLSEILEHPATCEAVAADTIAWADRVCGAVESKPDRWRHMELVDAIAMMADSRLIPRENIGPFGAAWGFDPAAFAAAVDAWRACDDHPGHGKGIGRPPSKWEPVAAALRSAGVPPPTPDTLRRQHEDWRRDRARG
jgi:hypothetical protein